MKKLFLFILLSFGIMTVNAQFAGGTGTGNDPFLIETPEQLDNVRNYLESYFKLNSNLNMTEYISRKYGASGWLPIGNENEHFNGVFDGNKYIIEGMYINRPNEDNVGFFGVVGWGWLENIVLDYKNNSVIGRNKVGGLCGYCMYIPVIYGCAVTNVNVSGVNNIGGLTGFGNGDYSECYATGSVSGIRNVGGLIGTTSENDSYIAYSYTACEIRGQSNTAGLVGYNEHSIRILYCVYDKELSGQTIGVSNDYDGDHLYTVIGRTTREMKYRENFRGFPFGFPFNIMDGCSYPFFTWYEQRELWSCNSCDLLGSGTSNDPYQIYTAKDLDCMRDYVENSNGKYFKLMNDIDLNTYISNFYPGDGWLPIGTRRTPFKGIFIGNNKKITGLWINRYSYSANAEPAGLFSVLDQSAEIRDLSVSTIGEGVKGGFTGILAGLANMNITISNCSVSGKVVGAIYAGGLIGYLDVSNGKIVNCKSDAIIDGVSYAGGLVGQTIITNPTEGLSITDCSTRGSVSSNGGYAGGLVASIEGKYDIKRCNTSGNITAGSFAGGFIAYALRGGSISECNNSGNVNAPNCGGFVDHNESKIYNCYNTGEVTSDSPSGSPAGFVKLNYYGGDIQNCYNEGAVNSQHLCGGFAYANNGGSIKKCYNAGSVTGNLSNGISDIKVGGFIAWHQRGTIFSCYNKGEVTSRTLGGGDKGGFAALNQDSIISCYNLGNLFSSTGNIGGFVGNNYGYISDSYTAASVSGNSGRIGGFIGVSNRGTSIRCYLDSQKSNTSNVIGYIYSPSNNTIYSRTTSAMITQNNYSGWDFNNTWRIQNNCTYPYFSWSPTPPCIRRTAKSVTMTKSDDGIQDNKKETIYIYPNPTTGIVTIETKLPINIKIYDIKSKLIKETKDNTVNLSDCPNGIYIFDINGKFEKVIKQ